MRLRAAVFAGLCAALPAPLAALGPPRPLAEYTHEAWQAKDGLPQSTIESILQGRDGYLWLGTQEGLVRFDGLAFEVFDRARLPAMTTNHVSALLEDPDGALWVGTFGGGLLRFRDGQVTAYTRAQGLSGDSVTALLRDRAGRLWVGTEAGGLDVLEAGRFRIHGVREGLPSDRVQALLLDRSGAVWVGTARGLARVQGGEVQTFAVEQGLPSPSVTSLVEDQDGRLWVGTTAGVARREGGAFRASTTRDGLPHDDVRVLHVDPQGSLWVGTTGGLARYGGGRSEAFTSEHGLTNDAVGALFTDREGSLWIGTNGGGLNRLREGKVTTYGQRHGLVGEEDTYAVAGARAGGLWVGSFRGQVHRFDGARFQLVLPASRLGGVRLRALHEDASGALWIGTDRGLHRLKGGRLDGAGLAAYLPGLAVRAIHEARDGGLWVGTDGGGLFRLKDGRTEAFGAEQGLPSVQVRAVLEDRSGRLWVGTYGGLAYWQEGRFHAYTTDHGLGHAFVRCLYESVDGTLWIGTYGGGLARLRDGKIRSITSAHGLLSDALYSVVEDSAGQIWMSCNKGIFRVARKDLDAVADGRAPRLSIVAFDEADGMRSRECNGGNPGGWRTPDGRLWFATPAGVVGVDPARLPSNSTVPPVVIERLRADGREVPPRGPVRLQPRPLRLEFQYAALSLVAPNRVRYRYKLEGVDQAWVEAGASRVAQYTRIDPGSYRFRVLACNNDGVWNDVGASLFLELAPAFHETIWFIGLAALGVALVAVALHRWRVVRLERRESELQARLQEGLARIKVLSGLLPICAACKNIRDDQGYWSQIEVYIRDHSEAQFTHGLCPACVEKLYPEYASDVLTAKK